MHAWSLDRANLRTAYCSCLASPTRHGRSAKRAHISPPPEQQQQQDEAPLPLLDLPDACLHHLVSLCSPMDRRLLARTCRRLRDLASSSDLHLLLVSGASARAAAAENVVSGAEAESSNSSGRQRCFSSLAAAVAASEAGDTIFCGPGRHCLQQPLVVHHALHILGAGEAETVLEGPAGGRAVIEFRCDGTRCAIVMWVASTSLSAVKILLEPTRSAEQRASLFCASYIIIPLLKSTPQPEQG